MARNDAHFGENSKKFLLQTYSVDCGEPASKRPRTNVQAGASTESSTTEAQSSHSSENDTNAAQHENSDSWHDHHLAMQPLPSHANEVGTPNGYRRDALLFVDERALQAPGMRDNSTTNLAFRPFVRFSSSHFQYVRRNGQPRLIQVNNDERTSVHAREHLNGEPPFERVGRTVVEGDVVA